MNQPDGAFVLCGMITSEEKEIQRVGVALLAGMCDDGDSSTEALVQKLKELQQLDVIVKELARLCSVLTPQTLIDLQQDKGVEANALVAAATLTQHITASGSEVQASIASGLIVLLQSQPSEALSKKAQIAIARFSGERVCAQALIATDALPVLTNLLNGSIQSYADQDSIIKTFVNLAEQLPNEVPDKIIQANLLDSLMPVLTSEPTAESIADELDLLKISKTKDRTAPKRSVLKLALTCAKAGLDVRRSVVGIDRLVAWVTNYIIEKAPSTDNPPESAFLAVGQAMQSEQKSGDSKHEDNDGGRKGIFSLGIFGGKPKSPMQAQATIPEPADILQFMCLEILVKLAILEEVKESLSKIPHLITAICTLLQSSLEKDPLTAEVACSLIGQVAPLLSASGDDGSRLIVANALRALSQALGQSHLKLRMAASLGFAFLAASGPGIAYFEAKESEPWLKNIIVAFTQECSALPSTKHLGHMKELLESLAGVFVVLCSNVATRRNFMDSGGVGAIVDAFVCLAPGAERYEALVHSLLQMMYILAANPDSRAMTRGTAEGDISFVGVLKSFSKGGPKSCKLQAHRLIYLLGDIAYQPPEVAPVAPTLSPVPEPSTAVPASRSHSQSPTNSQAAPLPKDSFLPVAQGKQDNNYDNFGSAGGESIFSMGIFGGKPKPAEQRANTNTAAPNNRSPPPSYNNVWSGNMSPQNLHESSSAHVHPPHPAPEQQTRQRTNSGTLIFECSNATCTQMLHVPDGLGLTDIECPECQTSNKI